MQRFAPGGPQPPEARGARVLLLGMMGVGKTTIGQCLSELTGWPYLDNDLLLVRAQGTSAAEILARSDETTLRAAESRALLEALKTPAPCIVGVAAGAVLDPANRQALQQGGLGVWLRAPLATLSRRIAGDARRPWLQPDPLIALERLYEGREALYREVADVIVDVDGRSPEEIAADLLSRLLPAVE
jgi:shikimate kinase